MLVNNWCNVGLLLVYGWCNVGLWLAQRWLVVVCMYVCIYLFTRHGYTKVYSDNEIIVNSVKISSPIGTISNSEVVDLQ